MEEITKIPNREEIPVEDTWATEDLYPSDEAWEAELATLEADKALFAGFAGHLADSAEKLLDYLTNMERVDEKFDKLLAFYRRGLSALGWDTYRSIDVRFADQVVCRR